MTKKITFKIDEVNPLLPRTMEQIDKNLPNDNYHRQRLVNDIAQRFPDGITVKYKGDINDPNVQQSLSIKIQLRILMSLLFDVIKGPITSMMIGIVIALIIIRMISRN